MNLACSFVMLVLPMTLAGQYEINGQLAIDTSWSPVVYLSAIPSFDEMYTVSEDMIVAAGQIDRDGKFKISGGILPEDDRLYRLHVSKKGDPPATIVIGGKDQNHVFLILSRSSHCVIDIEEANSLWGNYEINGCLPNQALATIDKAIAGYKDKLRSGFPRSREYAKTAMDEELRNIADSSQHPLISLYALYHTNYGKHRMIEPTYYLQFFEKWSDQKSTYFTSFKDEIGYEESSTASTSYDWWTVVFGVIIGLVLWPVYQRVFKRRQVSLSQKYALLSSQERKVFSCLRQGMSNKEISIQMHIEPSTVKSHVRNIYSKLEVSTRKDILNMNGFALNEI